MGPEGRRLRTGGSAPVVTAPPRTPRGRVTRHTLSAVQWWQHRIVDAGKEPVALCLIAFIVTFLLTRLITRMIRSGRGPFRDNVSSSGVHIHHAVPGLFLLLAGSLTSLAAQQSTSLNFAALGVGAGASLVLDEFALILHLQDVYWARQGRASVQAVALAGMVTSLTLLGFTPANLDELTDREAPVRYAAIVALTSSFVCCLICAMKGKYRLVVLAAIVPFVAYLGAVRLARPGSPWYGRYAQGCKKQLRAERRARGFDQKIAHGLTWCGDLVAGAPTAQDAMQDDAERKAVLVAPPQSGESPPQPDSTLAS